MKKWLSVILTCVMCITSVSVSANEQESETHIGFAIVFNGELTEYTSVIYNDAHYVPMRKVFEKFGAEVFYRNRDRQILALTRDGDIISHIVGDNSIVVNGEQKAFDTSSFLVDNETYIPLEMISAAFVPDGISYENQQLIIQKYMFNNDFHKTVKDILDVCRHSNFYPEKFQRYISYHYKMPDYQVEEIIFRVNLELDSPFYENATTIEQPYELLVLVNKYHLLPEGFKQYNLVNMDSEFTIKDGKEYLLEKGAYERFILMAEAAEKDGVSLKVVSAYRTEDYQRNLYNRRAKADGTEAADNYTARPGSSEHQTGLAVDINSTEESFELSAAFKWLQEHAHEYGFIMRYPRGKEWITGYLYEPWHYRYVGVDVAKTVCEEHITYEEYYSKFISVNEFR